MRRRRCPPARADMPDSKQMQQNTTSNAARRGSPTNRVAGIAGCRLDACQRIDGELTMTGNHWPSPRFSEGCASSSIACVTPAIDVDRCVIELGPQPSGQDRPQKSASSAITE